MKVVCSRVTLMVAALLTCASVARAEPFTFSLHPTTGAIFGAPGETVGWGYSVTNLSDTEWLVLSGLSADPFEHATPDASVFLFPIIAPGATLTVPYDGLLLEGLFHITWDATAPIGFTNSGTFVLSGESWDDDPMLGGQFLSRRPDQSAEYRATVTPRDTTPVPEPGTLLLIGSGITAMWWRRRSLPAQ